MCVCVCVGGGGGGGGGGGEEDLKVVAAGIFQDSKGVSHYLI